MVNMPGDNRDWRIGLADTLLRTGDYNTRAAANDSEGHASRGKIVA